MRLRTSLAAVVALVLVVVVAPEATGKGGTPITTYGEVVSTSAVLVQNLTCTGDGIIVAAHASRIKIDLAGHRLEGAGGTNDSGINAVGGSDLVTITNGVVHFFGAAVSAQLADHLSISNLIASGNGRGVSVSGNSTSVSSSNLSANVEVGITINGDDTSLKSVVADGNNEGIALTGDGAKVMSVNVAGTASASSVTTFR